MKRLLIGILMVGLMFCFVGCGDDIKIEFRDGQKIFQEALENEKEQEAVERYEKELEEKTDHLCS